jgi:metal-responsive CopG/Arc/MetJ family transcriptional regulator
MPEEVRRITVSLPADVYQTLETLAKSERRRASNLAAFLLERAIEEYQQEKATPRKESPKGQEKNE